jgi:spore maturation protein CgeB
LSNYNTIVYGGGFKGKVGEIPVKSYKGHKQQRNVYGITKINLDLPFFNTPHSFYKEGDKKYHIKNRFFEIPATGNFLLTVRCPEFLEIFGEDCVGYYDDSIESLQENVKKYLKDKDIRKKMSKKAYKLVNEKHTYLHRFKDMFKIIEK